MSLRNISFLIAILFLYIAIKRSDAHPLTINALKQKENVEIDDTLPPDGRAKRHVRFVYDTEFSSETDRVKAGDEKGRSVSKSGKNGTEESKKDPESKNALEGSGRAFKASVLGKVADKPPGKVRLCVHTYNRVAHSGKVIVNGQEIYDYDGVEYQDYEETEPVLSNITVEGKGMMLVEHCARSTDFCYAFWSHAAGSGEISILGQGCWESSDNHDSCSKDECTAEKATTKFCCCKSDLCNASPVSPPPATGVPATEESHTPSVVAEPSDSFLGKAVVAGLGGLVIISGAILVFLCCRVGKANAATNINVEHGASNENGGPGFSCSSTCVDNLKLHDNIGEGRHAKVWRGSLGGVPVAVKAVPAARAAMWTREKELYCLPHMTHSNLLAYLGCDSRPTLEGGVEHLLVLQLAPLGSLRGYLTAHTLDWDTYTKMALGVASALAHLHTHIQKDGDYKPCIVHRDVNSSNVVVRADLSLCLADLGLAMAIPDSRRAPQHHRIQEAGTLRYLAPEALEGALDLRRCGPALRAVDVYALALVLWELLSRCAPAHAPPGPAAYAPPYHAQVGEQPTLEQMQLAVARRKARPLFSPRLLATRGARLARDTCEDCWDHDAEARLTAVCVVERLSELRSLKPAPSPTVNNNDLRPPNSQHDTTNSHSPSSVEDKNSNVVSSANLPNTAAVFDFQPLQPYQGRNPCLERNLAPAGPGDRLIDKSCKDMPQNSSGSSANGYGTNDFIRTEQTAAGNNIRQQPQDFSRNEIQISTARITNRYTNQSSINLDPMHDLMTNEFRTIVRPVTPIGYVQNDVSSTEANSGECSHSHMTKQTNIKMEKGAARWSTRNLKRLLDSKVFKKKNRQNRPLETEVNLILANGKPINTSNGKIKTSVILDDRKVNRDDYINNYVRNTDNSIADRPSSLPGIDSVSLNENGSALNPENWKNLRHFNDNNTCTLSPPNQTIPNIPAQRTDDNLIVGFKEMPGSSQVPNCARNQNQVFAVIVPRSNFNGCTDVNSKDYERANWKHRNGKALLPAQSNSERNKKIENRLVNVANSTNLPTPNGVKRHSCDERVFAAVNRLTSLDASESGEKNNLIPNGHNRNSYSGEYEVGNFCVYNNGDGENLDPNMVDYSSNSEDEHMLLLSENDGSKITMRQRFDAKSTDVKNKKKPKQNLSSNADSSLTKITAGSFTSLCNKYAPKGKYENFDNECSEHLLDDNVQSSMNSLQDIRRKSSIIDRNDVSLINLVRNGSILSLCKRGIDDSLVDLDSEGHSKKDSDSDDSADDTTLRDDVFTNDRSARPLSIRQNLSRQHSLELVSEIFSSSADLARLKDPADRIKTPGDVPPSVRRVRGSVGGSRIKRTSSTKEKSKSSSANRLSLYDDRMMFGNSL